MIGNRAQPYELRLSIENDGNWDVVGTYDGQLEGTIQVSDLPSGTFNYFQLSVINNDRILYTFNNSYAYTYSGILFAITFLSFSLTFLT